MASAFSLKKLRGLFPLIFLSFFIVSCASYQSQLNPVQKLMTQGQPRAAAEKVKQKAFESGKDQVVYLMEYGTAMQAAGDFEESNRAFLLAEQLTEVKDYHSVSKITASLLTSARMIQYKGEAYEKVLINAMLAINFLMLQNQEAAMVEIRKLNEKLYRYRFEAKKPYEQNPFAFYLAALIREEDRDWDGAYIDYKRAYDLNPSASYLKKDLVRAAYRARRMGERKKWQDTFGLNDNQLVPKGHGELVVIYQQGWAPRKRPHPDWRRIPKLYRTDSMTNLILVEAAGKSEVSQSFFSVTDVAMKVLNDEYNSIVAQRVAGVAAKAVMADQLRQKNEALGQLAWIGMNIADQADLRQWFTLPSSYQIAKLVLPAGEHEVKIKGLYSAGGGATGESVTQTVVVKPGRKTFLQWRSVR